LYENIRRHLSKDIRCYLSKDIRRHLPKDIRRHCPVGDGTFCNDNLHNVTDWAVTADAK